MTLSIDLKAVFDQVESFGHVFTGTVGVIIGGPIAVLLISLISPETVGGIGYRCCLEGLSTLAELVGGGQQTVILKFMDISTIIWWNGICGYSGGQYLDVSYFNRHWKIR